MSILTSSTPRALFLKWLANRAYLLSVSSLTPLSVCHPIPRPVLSEPNEHQFFLSHHSSQGQGSQETFSCLASRLALQGSLAFMAVSTLLRLRANTSPEAGFLSPGVLPYMLFNSSLCCMSFKRCHWLYFVKLKL